jgi:hypothetical protein
MSGRRQKEKLRITMINVAYEMYLTLHRAHKADPVECSVPYATRCLTVAMGSKKSSWRVIGITAAALKAFSELNYHRKSRMGINRAHLKARIETTRELLARSQPLSQGEFLDTWLKNDQTVLCLSSENKAIVSRDIIPFANQDGELFSSGTISWRHGRREREHLKALFDKRGTLVSAPNPLPPLSSLREPQGS